MLQRLRQKIWLQIFIVYTRYLIGSAFVFASIVKIRGARFTAESGVSHPIDSSWHLFETLYQSGLYWKFLGVAQLISGFLLMTQRFAKLGALLNLPIITNVFVITISYYFALTPVITGLMLLANMMLLVWDWNALKVIINQTPIFDKKPRLESDITWQILGLCLFFIIVISNLLSSAKSLLITFLIVFITALIGLIIGFKRRTSY